MRSAWSIFTKHNVFGEGISGLEIFVSSTDGFGALVKDKETVHVENIVHAVLDHLAISLSELTGAGAPAVNVFVEVNADDFVRRESHLRMPGAWE